jgi:hypothetical protein
MTFFAGVFQIGVLISYVLFGVTTTQAYIYYSRFPDDSPKIKGLVCNIQIPTERPYDSLMRRSRLSGTLASLLAISPRLKMHL